MHGDLNGYIRSCPSIEEMTRNEPVFHASRHRRRITALRHRAARGSSSRLRKLGLELEIPVTAEPEPFDEEPTPVRTGRRGKRTVSERQPRTGIGAERRFCRTSTHETYIIIPEINDLFQPYMDERDRQETIPTASPRGMKSSLFSPTSLRCRIRRWDEAERIDRENCTRPNLASG